MKFLSIPPVCALVALAVLVQPLPAERWKMQYFYDENKTNLVIADLRFPSAVRGVAVGSVMEEGRRKKSVALVTSDGGAHWQTVELKETPISLFFLSENRGWMVTEKGLWETTEAGKNWRKLPKVGAEILRVFFNDEKNGWAAGFKKKVMETHDGGEHWALVAAATEPPGEANYSFYNWIAFASPQFGIIAGLNQPPRRTFGREFPDWMDPEEAVSRRETPHLSYSLITRDGGKTWKPNSASIFGAISKIRFGPNGKGLGLIEYSNSFRYPSEAYRIDWQSGSNDSVFRDRRYDISDIWLLPDGTGLLSGNQVTGQIRDVVPTKVQVLKSADLAKWSEMSVDYRAVASRTILAVVDDKNMWLATDTGMILKLEP